MNSINFGNVYLLLIAILLIVLFTVPFIIAVRKENRNGHNVASQIIHIVMAIIIALAAAGTTITTVLTETNVYVVADVSYSAYKNLDTIDNIIKKDIQLPKNCKMGLVVFGKDYELLSEPVEQKDIKSVKENNVDDSESNIAQALEYTGSLFKDGIIKRIVLITDGRQTDEIDTYAIKRAVDTLTARGIKVDARYLDDNLDPSKPEVQLSGAEFTKTAFVRHSESVNVTIQTNCDTRGTLYLYRDGEQMSSKAIELTEGTNVETLRLYTDAGGEFDYEVRVVADSDTSEYNNNYLFTQFVSDDLKLLVLTQNWNDVKYFVEQYGDVASLDIYEKDTSNTNPSTSEKQAYIRQFEGDNPINDKVSIRTVVDRYNNILYTTDKIPFTVEALSKYDEIIIANADITKLTNGTYSVEFVKNLNSVVAKLGKSLVTVGNVYIQDSDPTMDSEVRGSLTELGNMLPVKYGKDENAPKLYALVIDTSYSMTREFRMDKTKVFAGMVLDQMSSTDQLCIITFAGSATRLVSPPKTIGDIEEMRAEIEALDTNLKHGTVIGSGLESVYGVIGTTSLNAQVILITDGIDSSNSYDLEQLARDAYQDGIVTYTVGMDVTAANKTKLQNIANAGGGLYIDQKGENVNPGEFNKMASVDTYVTTPSTVSVAKHSDDVLAGMGVTDSSFPKVSGFIFSSAKGSATNVLQVEYKKDDASTPKKLPLYAHWKFGNGRVASFTTSFTPVIWSSVDTRTPQNGTKNWNKELKEPLVENILIANTPSNQTGSPYTFNVMQDGSTTRVTVQPADIRHKTSASIEIIYPDGHPETQSLALFDGSYYLYEFTSAGVGKYSIKITYTYSEIEYVSNAAVNVAYTNEYDAFTRYEPSVLFKAIDDRGTVYTEGPIPIVNASNDVGTYTADYTMPLLILCIALYVVDIVIRKLKWEDIVSFFGGFKKPDTTPTGGKK